MKQYFDPSETPAKRRRRIITGIVVCVLGLAFCLWAGWGWLIAVLLLADHYFTKYINWGWGRQHPNKAIRTVATLVGDLVYVVLVVTFLYTFFTGNFQIPSSSLEKTLLTGDYVFISKHKYGPRMPMTPLALPLIAHNRLGDHEVYSTTPTLGYRRLAGTGEVERYDLVVFNFPAGDTVAVSMSNPDYLTLCHLYGRDQVRGDRATFGEVIYRPVDRRDHYVKRCIGLPGERLSIRGGVVYIDGKEVADPELVQFNYMVQTDGRELTQQLLDLLEVNYRDVALLLSPQSNPQEIEHLVPNLRIDPLDSLGGYGRVYEMPLTQANVQALRHEPGVMAVRRVPRSPKYDLTYPLTLDTGWTIDDFGPLLIPRRGLTITLDETNYAIYERCIRAYEGHSLERTAQGRVLIDGVETTSYTFAMDYYFMMGDNRHNSADSRVWGFVPEDHIVGQPALIWLSINDEQPLLSGGIRWRRLFSLVTDW